MEDCLLDTHAFLWFINGSDDLSNKAKLYIENPQKTQIRYAISGIEINNC